MVYIFAIFLYKSHVCEKSSSWSQNTLGQSDCRIFKSAEQNDEIDELSWFFLPAVINARKLKVYINIFGWVWSNLNLLYLENELIN